MDQQRIGQEAAWWARQDSTRCVSGILAGMPSRFVLNKSLGRPVRSLFLGKRQLRAGLGRASLRVGGAANRVQAWTDSYLSIGNYAGAVQRMEVPIDLRVEVDAGTADPVLFQAVPIDPIVPKTEPVTEEDMVEEETRVTPTPTRKEETRVMATPTRKETRVMATPTRKETRVTPTPTRKEETRTSQLRDAVQEAYLEDSDSGLQDLDLEWSKLDEKEERKGVSFLGNLLAQQSTMLKGFKKSPAPAACPAPKVRQFRGERRSSRRKSMVFFPEAADIVQEKQESTDMSSGEDSCDQYVPPPSADDYSSDDSAVESPSDEEAPPAKKRKEVSNEEKDLFDSSAKGFVARTIAEFEASSAGTDVPAVAADVPAEESESDTDEADEPVRRTEVPAVAADVPAEESGSDTEADDPQQADEPVRRRTRRAATKVYKGDTKRPRRECQIEGCTAAVVNLRRHMTVCHPDAEAVPVKTKGRPRDQGNRTYGGRLECGLCGSNTIRMDVHLKTVHKLEKDSEEFREAIQGAVPYEEGTQAQQELQQALVDYGKTMTDRACGIARKATTTQSHLTAVKFWLPTGLTRQALLDLEKIGTLDGEVNRHLQEDRVKPATLRVYLHSLAGFLQFLAGKGTWLRHLRLLADQLTTLSETMKTVSKSLKEDVLIAKVASHARGEDILDLEPAQIAKYLDGQRPTRARTVIEKAERGEQLSRAEKMDARNILCLQLLLSNAKRAGDITHLRRADVLAAVAVDGTDIEIEVFEHKEARSGKICHVRIAADLLGLLQVYATHLSLPVNPPEKPQPYLFLTGKGEFLTPSAMSKLVQTE
ncbi:uncharacterized protein [Mytilus edulis]|uniref:uncharacterized protein n=1 Tax=Mytilus edulis TaxID=6550 RepID=UPI0039F043E1